MIQPPYKIRLREPNGAHDEMMFQIESDLEKRAIRAVEGWVPDLKIGNDVEVSVNETVRFAFGQTVIRVAEPKKVGPDRLMALVAVDNDWFNPYPARLHEALHKLLNEPGTFFVASKQTGNEMAVLEYSE